MAAIGVLMTIVPSASVFAIPEDLLYFYGQNNIVFFDPTGNAYCVGDNMDYNGQPVWSESDLAAVEANRPFYESAANKYGFPWQMLAAIHYREHSLLRSNPGNGQGIYQLYSYTAGGTNSNSFYPAGAVSDDEFQRQTDIAASIVAQKGAGMNLGSLTDGDIQRIFYYYNGANSNYAEKGRQLGLTEEEIGNGGGSPYVMNKFDAMRDPDNAVVSPYWVGAYTSDGVYSSGAVDRRYGAFVLYAALAGSSSCSYSGGSIAETALLLSWEGRYSHNKNDPKPEYVDAMKQVGAYQRGNGYYPYGASCDQFVGTVMRYSGADENFPIFGPEVQENYMISHPEMYEKVNANGDFSLLQPGDIFVTVNAGRHIYLYVGIIDGKMTQASASADDRTAEHYGGSGAVYFTDSGISSYGNRTRYYNVYRRVGN